MNNLKIISVLLFLTTTFVNVRGQRDTVKFFPDKGEYEIYYQTKIAERDTFLTVIFIPSTKISPTIHSNIYKISIDNSFYYNYLISNGIQSKQGIEFFLLKIDKNVSYSDSSKNKWFGNIDERLDGGYSWFDTTVLAPSREKGGFKIISKNLPGVGNAYFQGQLPFYTLSEEETSDFLDNALDSLSSFPRNYVLRKTVVPVYISPTISYNDFLDTLKSYIRQAYSLNWIVDKKEDNKEKGDKEKKKDSEIVKELRKSIGKAREQLSKNKTKEAKKKLEEFVEKVEEYYEKRSEKEKGKGERGYLTGEAYALLKYNAEYLIGQLK